MINHTTSEKGANYICSNSSDPMVEDCSLPSLVDPLPGHLRQARTPGFPIPIEYMRLHHRWIICLCPSLSPDLTKASWFGRGRPLLIVRAGIFDFLSRPSGPTHPWASL